MRLIGDLWWWRIAAAAMSALVCVVGQSLPALALWAIVVAILPT
jgi:hypothetical protein